MPFSKPTSYTERLESLTDWQPKQKEKFNLYEFAKAGFYFDRSYDAHDGHDGPRRLRCAFCRTVISNWVPKDNPWREHVRSMTTTCPHVLIEKGEEFVDNLHMFEEDSDEELDDDEEDDTSVNQVGFFGLEIDRNLTRSEQKVSSPPTDLTETAHPEMSRFDPRLKSFEGFVPESKAQTLAQSGFYLEGDKARCHSCRLRVECTIDQVWEIHAQSDCRFVERKKGREFVEYARSLREALETTCDESQDTSKTSGQRTDKRKLSEDHAESDIDTASQQENGHGNKKLDRGPKQEKQVDHRVTGDRPTFHNYKGRLFKIEWRKKDKKRRTNQHQTPNAQDGDIDRGGCESTTIDQHGEDEVLNGLVFLCCNLRIQTNEDSIPCPECRRA